MTHIYKCYPLADSQGCCLPSLVILTISLQPETPLGPLTVTYTKQSRINRKLAIDRKIDQIGLSLKGSSIGAECLSWGYSISPRSELPSQPLCPSNVLRYSSQSGRPSADLQVRTQPSRRDVYIGGLKFDRRTFRTISGLFFQHDKYDLKVKTN